MIYQEKTFQGLVELMASCEKLGLPYIVQKQPREKQTWFGRTDVEMVYVLQVVQYVEESESSEEENSDRRPSEDSETETDQ